MRYCLLSLLLALCGCGTSLSYIPTNDPPRALYVRDPGQVEIYMTRAPDRPAVEVGMIESQQQEMSLDNQKEVIGKMRLFAGKRGCDALVIFSGNDATVGHGGPNYSSVSTLKGYRGSCLVYTGPAKSVQPAPAAAAAAAPPAETPAAPTTAASSCMPNSTQLCYGPGGCRGGQRCTDDGRAYTLCDCGNAAVSQSTAQP